MDNSIFSPFSLFFCPFSYFVNMLTRFIFPFDLAMVFYFLFFVFVFFFLVARWMDRGSKCVNYPIFLIVYAKINFSGLFDMGNVCRL